MVNDSLIDSLRTACFRLEGELVLRFDAAIKIIRQHTAAPDVRASGSLIEKFEKLRAQGCPSIEIDSIITIIKEHSAVPVSFSATECQKLCEDASDGIDNALKIEKQIEQPVSVSIERCASAIRNMEIEYAAGRVLTPEDHAEAVLISAIEQGAKVDVRD